VSNTSGGFFISDEKKRLSYPMNGEDVKGYRHGPVEIWQYKILTLEQELLCRSTTALVGLSLLIVEVSRSHSDTPNSVGLLWTSDQPVAETST
jgi:hypothetical protein